MNLFSKSSVSSRLNLQSSKNRKRLLIGIGLVVLLFIVSRIFHIPSNSATLGASTSTSSPIKIDKSYIFAARNDQEKLVDKRTVKMTIVNAEISKQILIKGQPATAKAGKAFLIFTVDLQNDSIDSLYLPVNKLMRWQEGDKLRAPDVHNNLVVIDPISSKSTRVGFLIDENQKAFTLKVGEVNGDKQTVDIKF